MILFVVIVQPSEESDIEGKPAIETPDPFVPRVIFFRLFMRQKVALDVVARHFLPVFTAGMFRQPAQPFDVRFNSGELYVPFILLILKKIAYNRSVSQVRRGQFLENPVDVRKGSGC
jgi:hypothetical protein